MLFIKKIVLNHFKRFKDSEIELAEGVSLLVGGNNSGKSSLLHALATWEFCKTVLLFEKSPSALLQGFSGDGYGIAIDDFTPINIPSFKYLWTNLHIDPSYSLSINCYWDLDDIEKHLNIGLALIQERLFIKNLDSNVQSGETIPHVAYLPTFAGINSKEQWVSTAVRNKYIGQGLAGAVLRNQSRELHRANLEFRNTHKGPSGRLSDSDLIWLRDNDPYELLQQVIFRIFKGFLYPKKFNPEFHTHVLINFRKGELINNRFKPFTRYAERDIMVEGSGFLQWLSVYTFALAPKIDVLLLDEPDAHLHCSLQNELISQLKGISEKKQKQVLIATHSSEVIKSFDYRKLLYIDRQSASYLANESLKVRVLSGLGSEYFPLLERIQKNKRVLFVENLNDAKILEEFCNKYSHWPQNLVVWPMANKHSERKHLYLYLKDELSELKCLSLSDRDNEVYENTRSDLHCLNMPDLVEDNKELRYRTWRRKEIESYLLGKPAIIRLIMQNRLLVSEEEAVTILDRELARLGVVVNDDYMLSDQTDSNRILFDIDPKHILDNLCSSLEIDKYQIVREMRENEIFDDVRTLINEIVTMCVPGTA